jgi:uncharacterized protein YggE
MRKSFLVWAPLLFGSVAFGQLDSNSITVSASRNASLQPDQAVFAVTVETGIGTSLDDVVASLQGSGITGANLSSVATPNQYSLTPLVPTLQWVFTLPAPLTKTKETLASLTALQQSIAKLNNGMTLSFYILGTQVSQQLAQSQTCSIPALVADATAHAQTLAAAGGLTLGAIVAMSSVTSNFVQSPQTLLVSGSFSALAGTGPLAPPCAITVKFNTTRY